MLLWLKTAIPSLSLSLQDPELVLTMRHLIRCEVHSYSGSSVTAANIIIDQVLSRVSQMLVDDDAAAKASALHFKKKSATSEASVCPRLLLVGIF